MRNEIIIHIPNVGDYNEEECLCANCGTYYNSSRQMYHMNNDDFVCSKKCFREYSESYLNLQKVK